jgi:hypothetical protein
VFERACGLHVSAGCDNTSALTQGPASARTAQRRSGSFRREAPTIADYQFILRGSKGPIRDREPAQLYARACDQGFPGTCANQ